VLKNLGDATGLEFLRSVGLMGCKRFDPMGNPFGFVLLSSKVGDCLITPSFLTDDGFVSISFSLLFKF